MIRIRVIFLWLIVLTWQCDAADNDWLVAKLEQICSTRELPGIAAAAIQNGEITFAAASGLRKLGAPNKVTVEDKWHIGSCTKSMTATLAAMLIDGRLIGWDTTVGDVFPDWGQTMMPEWRHVTLELLLTHRGGAPGSPPREAWVDAWKRRGTPTDQRTRFVRSLLRTPPSASPGSAFIYSNQGYAIAGAMLEKRAKRPWEELIRVRLFMPLQMRSAGFGAPSTPGKVDQPWGHRRIKGILEPVPAGPNADNPPAIGPAGTVHCSIADLARYAGWHARPAHAGHNLLGETGFSTLHRPVAGQEHAMGWLVADRKWAGGSALSHSGSNTMFYAVMWVAHQKNAAFVAATNAAGPEAERGADDAVAALIARVFPG